MGIIDVIQDIVVLLVRMYCDMLGVLASVLIRLPYAFALAVKALFVGNPKPKRFSSVLVTGASVGIGAALAVEFAEPGVEITITARSEDACKSTKAKCEAKGASCTIRAIDVRDTEAMKGLVEEAHQKCPLDLVIANAGCTPNEDGLMDAPYVLTTNVVGAANTVVPAVSLMLQLRDYKEYSPQIVLLSSMGGHSSSGSLFMASYTASKSAVRIFGESLRTSLSPHIGVTVLCPGMTESRMVATHIAQGVQMRTGVWGIDKATKFMADGIRSNAAEVNYPFLWYTIAKTYGSTPTWMKDIIAPLTRIGDPYNILDQRAIFRPKEPEKRD